MSSPANGALDSELDLEDADTQEGRDRLEQVESDSEVSFAQDKGVLPVSTRRVFVLLLSGPSVDGRRTPKAWGALLRDEAMLRSRLHELFLELVIDREQQVAFTRQVVAPELDLPILLRRASLTFLETALLLFLRQHLTQADAQGERAVLDLQTMQEHLRVYEKSDNVDRSRFERQIGTAIEKAKKLNLLQKLRSSDERYEVSPTLKLLFPAEEIEQLTRTYEALVAGTTAAGPESGADAQPAATADGEPTDAPTDE